MECLFALFDNLIDEFSIFFILQLFGGYVLHTCLHPEIESSMRISKSRRVKMSLNKDRRDKIAPNHTSTHLLNSVLREVSL